MSYLLLILGCYYYILFFILLSGFCVLYSILIVCSNGVDGTELHGPSGW